MAARLALVVTGVGAIPELITDRQSGMLVESRNADSLARALGEVIIDGRLRENLAREAYQIAMRDFEVEAAVDRLVHEIEDTIVAGREHRLSGRTL
jgi:glycosyltransferase involved in cell wall biosynthesis